MKKIPTVTASFEGPNLMMTVPTVSGQSVFDLWMELSWGGNPDEGSHLEEHAPREAWWTARLADEQYMQEMWVKTVYDPYMAHLRRFATYALGGQDMRRKDVTKSDIEDMVMRVYTENATSDDRDGFFGLALYGYLWQKYGGKSAKETTESLAKNSPPKYNAEYQFLKAEIFKYQEGEDPVWYEEMERRKAEVDRSVRLVEAAVSAFRSRGYLLRQAAENEKARKNAIGAAGFAYEEIVAKILPLVKKGLSDD